MLICYARKKVNNGNVIFLHPEQDLPSRPLRAPQIQRSPPGSAVGFGNRAEAGALLNPQQCCVHPAVVAAAAASAMNCGRPFGLNGPPG